MAVSESRSSFRKYVGAFDIDGQLTDVSIMDFSDKWFIVITQFGKIGNLLSVTPNASLEAGSSVIYNTKVLFGKDEVEIHAFANFLAQKIQLSKGLLLGLALKDFRDLPSARKIVSKVLQEVEKL